MNVLSAPPFSASSSTSSSSGSGSASTSTLRPPSTYTASRPSSSSGRSTPDNSYASSLRPSSRASSRARSLAPTSAGSSHLSSGSAPASASGSALPLKGHGVRAHLKDMLPISRHAIFAVKLTIHQLWNVPLVSGQFCVRWKFAHLHRVRRIAQNGHSHNGLNGIGNALGLNEKGKEKAGDEVEQDPETDPPSSGASILSVPSYHSGDSSSPSTSPQSTIIDLPQNLAAEFLQDPRGQTEYAPLKEHHVKWGKEVNVAVQMAIARDTQELQPSELKFVIEQEVLPGDPDAPQNPRLGVVRLNLAEYVDEGPVTRRYLLRESKTNATLQLTIHLTHVGGEASFRAPPLSKGEVMAGVATLLDKNSYSGGLSSNRALPMPTVRTHRRAVDNGSRSGFGSISSGRRLLPELKGGGVRTTDNIIEAIFNPVPSSSPATSPFTYYAPPKQKLMEMSKLLTPKLAITEEEQEDEEDGGRTPSIAPSEMSQQSQATDSTHETAGTNVSNTGGEGQPRKKWWRRFGGNGNSRAQSPQRRSSDNQSRCESPGDSVHSLPASLEAAKSPGHPNSSLSPPTHEVQLQGLESASASAPQIVVRVRGPTIVTAQSEQPPEER